MGAFSHIRPDYIQHLNERVSAQIDKAIAEPNKHHLFSLLVKSSEGDKINYTFEVSKQGLHLNFVGIVSIDNIEYNETHYRLLIDTIRQMKHHMSHNVTHPNAAMKGLLNAAKDSADIDTMRNFVTMALEQQISLDEQIIKMAHFL